MNQENEIFIFPKKSRGIWAPETNVNEWVITLNMEMNPGIVVGSLCRSKWGSNQ